MIIMNFSKRKQEIHHPYKWDISFCRNPSHRQAGRASAHHHFPPVQQQLPDVRTAKLSGCIVRAVVDFSVVDCSPSTKQQKVFLRENATSHIRNRRSLADASVLLYSWSISYILEHGIFSVMSISEPVLIVFFFQT